MKYGFIFLILFSVNSLKAQNSWGALKLDQLSEAEIDKLSNRFLGQTSFINKESYFPRPMYSTSSGLKSEGVSSIQESDVYKIGKPGSSIVFLLNTYQGLQIIDFSNGLSSPKLSKRLKLEVGYNSEMYYEEASEKIITLSSSWADGKSKTLISSIDVSDLENPKLMKTTHLEGDLSQSRMVGNILYIVTSGEKARIVSIDTKSENLDEIDQKDIIKDGYYIRNMNVVENEDKFYVMVSDYNWDMSGDRVNVFEISDRQGKIEKLIEVKALGRINEKSQLSIHKNSLIIVSNYRENDQALMRIAVETFSLKKSDELVKASQVIKVGSTQGQHASLQDVRIDGDLLYAFWVPSNNIDPFELFDITNPLEEVRHLGQLQFEGWISRAIPLSFKGKKYVLGLGWIIPASGEGDRRYPQAKLFEITKNRKGYSHKVIATQSFDDLNVWTNLNGEDKEIHLISKEEGKYQVLFPVMIRESDFNYRSGGQLVDIDLSASKLSNGGNLVSSKSWLKRIFDNPELQAISAFSNEELETFDLNNSAEKLKKSVSVLELARNIVGYTEHKGKGIQIVQKKNRIEFRYVDLNNSDAQKDEVIRTQNVSGHYLKHLVYEGKLYVVAYSEKEIEIQSGDYTYDSTIVDQVFFVEVTRERVNTISSLNIEELNTRFWSSDFYKINKDQLLLKANKDIFTLDFSKKKIEKTFFSENCKNFMKEGYSFDLTQRAGDLFLINEVSLGSMKKKDESGNEIQTFYSQTFMTRLHQGFTGYACEEFINIPDNFDKIIGDSFALSTGYDDTNNEQMSYVLQLDWDTISASLTDVKRNIGTLFELESSLLVGQYKKDLELYELSSSGRLFMTDRLNLESQSFGSGYISQVIPSSGGNLLLMIGSEGLGVVRFNQNLNHLSLEPNVLRGVKSIQDIFTSERGTLEIAQGFYGMSSLKL